MKQSCVQCSAWFLCWHFGDGPSQRVPHCLEEIRLHFSPRQPQWSFFHPLIPHRTGCGTLEGICCCWLDTWWCGQPWVCQTLLEGLIQIPFMIQERWKFTSWAVSSRARAEGPSHENHEYSICIYSILYILFYSYIYEYPWAESRNYFFFLINQLGSLLRSLLN